MSKARGKPRPAPRPSPTPAPPSPALARRRRVLDQALPIIVAATFFALVWTLYPFHNVSEFDPDEGNNVIKALMMARGHELYSEIWNDQPPLFTYMLRGWMGVAGWTAHQARVFVLICSSVLLWALYQTVRPTWGHGGAIACVCLLTTTWRYVALSVSAMLAIPTLMLAMLSVYFAALYRHRSHPVWPALSGVLLALSLFTKLFALPLAPLLVGALAYMGWSQGREAGQRWRWLVPPAVWIAAFGLSAAVLFFAFIPWSEAGQLIRPHLDARQPMSGKGWDDEYFKMLRADGLYALFGLLGVVHIVRRREWLSALPIVWYGISVAALYRHRPLWYHHYVLLSLPLAWMAAAGLGPLLSGDVLRAWRPWKGASSAFAVGANAIALVMAIVALAQSPKKLERETDYAQDYVRMTPRDNYIIAVMKQFKDETHYVITDRQMLPFSAGLIVPPEVSVTSKKRFESGHLTVARLLELLDQYKPEQVFLSWRRRIPRSGELQVYLKNNYRLVYSNEPGDMLYVDPTLADKAASVLEKAVTEVPQSEEGWYNWASQLANTGENTRAVDALRQSLHIRPTRTAYEMLAKVLERLGKPEDAKEAMQKAERFKR